LLTSDETTIIRNPYRADRHINHSLDHIFKESDVNPGIYDLTQCVNSFILGRKAQNLSDGTIRFYMTKMELLTGFLVKLEISQISDITPQTIRDYLIYLEEKGHNAGGIHAAYRALKAFLNWWEGEFEPSNWKNPIKKVRAPKVPLEILEPVKSDEAIKLLAVCNIKSLLGLRDCAIILTLMDTGVRASELLALTRKDLDLRSGKIVIRKGKGGKFRIVFISEKTQQVIKRYLEERSDFSSYLWITKINSQLQYSGLRQIIRRRAKDANIEPPSLHSFRRFFALQMLRSGVDIFSLQRLMGHSDIQILRRYLQQTEQDIRSAHELGGPVNNLLGLK
jgi:site-specific recombinase XerD